MTYSITYEVITPESAEVGDAAERGYLVDPTQYQLGDLREILSNAQSYGIVGTTRNNLTGWFCSINPQRDHRDGSETYYSLHFDNDMTGSSFSRVGKLLNGRI